MIRISTIFIAICMVLVAASLGLVLYSVAGISGPESAIVALTALTFLILYNAVRCGCATAPMSAARSRICRAAPPTLRVRSPNSAARLAAVEGRLIRPIPPAPTASRRSSARSTNLAGWSSSSPPRSRAMTICFRRASRRARRARGQARHLEPQNEFAVLRRTAEARRRSRHRDSRPRPSRAALRRAQPGPNPRRRQKCRSRKTGSISICSRW